MLLIVHECFLMQLSRKIIVFKPTLQKTNKFFFLNLMYRVYFNRDKLFEETRRTTKGLIKKCQMFETLSIEMKLFDNYNLKLIRGELTRPPASTAC